MPKTGHPATCLDGLGLVGEPTGAVSLTAGGGLGADGLEVDGDFFPEAPLLLWS